MKQDMTQSFELCYAHVMTLLALHLSLSLAPRNRPSSYILLVVAVFVILHPSALGRVLSTRRSRTARTTVRRIAVMMEPTTRRHTAHVSRESARRPTVMRTRRPAVTGREAHVLTGMASLVVICRLALVVRSLVSALTFAAAAGRAARTTRPAHAGVRATRSAGEAREATRVAWGHAVHHAVRRAAGRAWRGEHAGAAQHGWSHHTGAAHARGRGVRVDNQRARRHMPGTKST
jgi:hypothetical protein